ncbi:hypothetical protein [Lentzea terrae]|uniref:hypothetical protein n=1 Tax=Lentzea terrae TaxID=2200761 RepID=UPI000DD454AB|nr:hypothetical protein [Lentzea terrae]
MIGVRRFDQFEMNLGALDVTLTEAQRATLDEVSAMLPMFATGVRVGCVGWRRFRRGWSRFADWLRSSVVAWVAGRALVASSPLRDDCVGA